MTGRPIRSQPDGTRRYAEAVGATSTRDTRELLITALLAVLGAVLMCGWIWLAKRSPEDSLAVSITRVFLHSGLPQPVTGNALVAFVAALPGVVAFGIVLTWQLRRRRRERRH